MRIKLLKTAAGPEGVNHAGDIIEVSREEGIEYLTSGSAILLESENDNQEPEKLSVEVVEKAFFEAETTDNSPIYKRRGRPPIKR